MRNLVRRENADDDFVAAYLEMLKVMHRLYDLGGDPNIRGVINRAESALGSVPHQHAQPHL